MKEELCAFNSSKDEGSVPPYKDLGSGRVTAKTQLMF